MLSSLWWTHEHARAWSSWAKLALLADILIASLSLGVLTMFCNAALPRVPWQIWEEVRQSRSIWYPQHLPVTGSGLDTVAHLPPWAPPSHPSKDLGSVLQSRRISLKHASFSSPFAQSVLCLCVHLLRPKYSPECGANKFVGKSTPSYFSRNSSDYSFICPELSLFVMLVAMCTFLLV